MVAAGSAAAEGETFGTGEEQPATGRPTAMSKDNKPFRGLIAVQPRVLPKSPGTQNGTGLLGGSAAATFPVERQCPVNVPDPSQT
ncbi:hypothetical protein SK1NUM_12780 [Arachnia rubra]|nr:hypothetical protein SK1NUM_12780 [Arachnia rubra]